MITVRRKGRCATTEARRLRIGVILRHLDKKGGIVVYTRNLVEQLLRIDQRPQSNAGLF